MTAPARLLSVRLQGFKSFAERTHVAFGPGISAIVGPNGSGKSNLADALRWALGEQGRALRSRKAEDVIWAGSERRPALGMADVQLTLDNGDALLPVEFGVVELGRRLFRSGENDYLLNRQRVRLRDLVELLDGANLSENAFLFIGQGMVDQALALRPEERRPLFEEVAGVRRPERRRRRAEEQLAEAEANLARVEDILGELRPQARRLAQQAEQQTSRRSAADELAEAILLAAHGRWHAAARRVAAARVAAEAARGAIDGAMAALYEHERAAAELAGRLAARAPAESERRAALERAREALTTRRLEDGRLAADLAGLGRELDRVAAERSAAEAELQAARDALAVAAPGAGDPGGDAAAALADVEAQLALAREELADARARTASDVDAGAIRRLAAARTAEHEAAARRAAEAERLAREERSRADAQARIAASAAAARESAAERLAAAIATEETARAARERARLAADAADAERRAAHDAAGAARASVAASEARAAEARLQLEADETDAFRAAARSAGGRPVDRDLDLEPALAAAVEGALAELGRGVVVGRGAIAGLLERRGLVVIAEALDRAVGAADDAEAAAFIAEVRARGGGLLREAVRRDGSGAARRLLRHAAWLPSAAACLELQVALPIGWILVSADGSLVVRVLTASIRPDGGLLRRRADVARLDQEVARARTAAEASGTALAAAVATADAAHARLAAARTAETEAVAARRRLEEEDRAAAGAAASAGREAAWLAAQVQRLEGDADRLRAIAAERAAAIPASGASSESLDGEPVATGDVGSIQVALEGRVRELGARREQLAASAAEAAAARADADRRRARAEATSAMAERRLAELARAAATLAEREASLAAERDAVGRAIAEATQLVADAGAALDAVLGEDAGDREALRAAEAATASAREALRVAEEGSRGVEREELEARLALEGLRESVLVDLAGLGALGLRHLGSVPGGPDASDAAGALDVDGPEPDVLEAALATAAEAWQSTPPAAEPPTPGRIAALRRRFHELGAGNPFAVEEYAEVKLRLDAMETQRADLLAAIDQTRTMIRELEQLIGEQFRATFAALEQAFDDRFRQLFGGGFAKLSLTDPEDLTATGVEITARPPGKKPQALAMLSGGERALTAVALLFAMLEVRPVPFCVLDEVDAALDEANIGRFTEALRELAARTQCIVITHNRGTIETADALYGVTVGDDSVSRVISLRLDEATELASRDGRRAEPQLVVGG